MSDRKIILQKTKRKNALVEAALFSLATYFGVWLDGDVLSLHWLIYLFLGYLVARLCVYQFLRLLPGISLEKAFSTAPLLVIVFFIFITLPIFFLASFVYFGWMFLFAVYVFLSPEKDQEELGRERSR